MTKLQELPHKTQTPFVFVHANTGSSPAPKDPQQAKFYRNQINLIAARAQWLIQHAHHDDKLRRRTATLIRYISDLNQLLS